MEVEFRPCKPGHFEFIEVQEQQRQELAFVVSTDHKETLCSHVAISAWLGNKCLGAAGFVPMFSHRAIAWALIAHDIGPALVPVSRKIRHIIALDPTPRIEMTVDVDFEAGHKWAKLLGMKQETEALKYFGALGNSEIMYARIRK